MMNLHSLVRGSLFGMAIGDGYGLPTEFLKVEEIKRRWGVLGPKEPEGNPILVTDDTQMAICVAKALMASEEDEFSSESLENALRANFVQWLNDPLNNRAPGMTCIRSCERLEKGLPWEKSTELNSKGCGANMRVVPVGLLTTRGLSEEKIGQIAQFQSAITHGHPTALAASEITAIAITKILNGVAHETLIDELLEYSNRQLKAYHKDFLNEIWDRAPFRTPQEFINLGWEQIIDSLKKVREGLKKGNTEMDPCLITGEGWVAEESLATALLCFLYFPKQPAKAMRRAVLTSGDSDSIACLTGAFSGAYNGIEKIPQDWVNRIEYKAELEEIANYFSNSKMF